MCNKIALFIVIACGLPSIKLFAPIAPYDQQTIVAAYQEGQLQRTQETMPLRQPQPILEISTSPTLPHQTPITSPEDEEESRWDRYGLYCLVCLSFIICPCPLD